MRPSLAARAEVTKIARLLGAPAAELAYLERLPAEDLRELRDQATDMLFRAHRGPLRRIAMSAGVTPPPLAASLAERVFGPLLCARIAGEVAPARAAEIARRLPDGFLAEVAVELDPRRASAVIARIPTERLVAVGSELARRHEYVAIGSFVGHVSDESLRASIEAIDDEALLRTAFVLEGKDRLDMVVRSLPEERLRGLARSATDAGLWPETLDLLCHLEPELRARLAAMAAAEGEDVLDSLIAAVDEQGLWPELEPLVPLLPARARQRIGEATGR